MAIKLDQAEIDAALSLVGDGLGQYLWLQARVAEAGNFHRDAEFRRRFNRFYRVRRGLAWQERFYGLMARTQKEELQSEDVLQALHTATGRYEASFASKLIATLDPSKPVIDAFVLRNVGLRLPTYAARDRAARLCDVYSELVSLFAELLDGEIGKYLVSEFTRTYPHSGITQVKMLDLVLWQARRGPVPDSRANVIEPLTPSGCPRCGALAVAEILYGLPAFDEELLDRELDAGHVVLGGCCVSDGMPQWRCRTCNHAWGALPGVETDQEDD